MAKQSVEPVIVMVFDDYWVVNGVKLKREYINDDEQIRLLKSILARTPIQLSLEVNNGLGYILEYNKKEQIHILKSMMIKRIKKVPKVSINFLELPKIEQDSKPIQSAIDDYLRSIEIDKKSDDIGTNEKNVKTESGDQFKTDYQVLPETKKEILENSY